MPFRDGEVFHTVGTSNLTRGPNGDVVSSTNAAVKSRRWHSNFDVTPNFAKRYRENDLLPLNSYLNKESEISFDLSSDHSLAWYDAKNYWSLINGDLNDAQTNDEFFSKFLTTWSGTRIYDSFFPLNVGEFIPDSALSERFVGKFRPQELITSAAADAYGDLYDALTFLAELAETVEMFLGLGKFLIEIAKNPLNWSRPWMAWRYGWRPFFSDVEAMVKFFTRKHDKITRLFGSHSLPMETSEEVDFFYEALNSPSLGHIHFKRTNTFSVQARAQFRSQIKPIIPFRADADVTLWEMVPLSFVIDWFINIGEYLLALHAVELSEKHYCAWSRVITATSTIECVGLESHDSDLFFAPEYHIKQSYKTTLKQRIPSNIDPTIPFSLRLNPYQILDLISILKGRRRKRWQK